MSELNRLADAMEQHFVNPRAISFVHFVVVSDGLTGAQATYVPGERFNSIWAITNHMAFWMDYTHAAFLDEDIDLAAWEMEEVGQGWPPLGTISDERTLDPAILEQLQERLWGGTPFQAISAMYGHNCYHTAELLTVRHMQGLWVDHKYA
jgi:hypothetical protein